MYSNFKFLEDEKNWEVLYTMGKIAEMHVYDDPNTSLVKIRQIGEFIAKSALELEKIKEPVMCDQNERINILKREELINKDIENIFHTIRKAVNKATHQFSGESKVATLLLSFAFKLSGWFKELYGSDYNFDINKIKYHEPENKKIENEKLYKELDKRYEEIKDKEVYFEDLLSTLVQRREKVEKLKVDFSEKETRFLIDNMLREAGWLVDTEKLDYKNKKVLPKKNQNIAIAEWPCKKEDNSVGFADYALFIDRKMIGLIEAKAYNIDIPSALEADGKTYAKSPILVDEISFLENEPFTDYKVPFIYSSNGRDYNKFLPEKSGIYFYDGRKSKNLSKPIKGFHSPRDLRDLLKKDEMLANKNLENQGMEYLQSKTGLNLRYYQIEAIKAVEKSILDGQENILLTMATGTGKTKTAIGLAYRLLKARKFNRILFIVDRSALGTQAEDSFKNVKIENLQNFGEIYDIKNLGDKIPDDDTKLHIATVQGLMKRIFYNKDENSKPTIGQYDCIIIDEAHRGYILDRDLNEYEILYKDQMDYLSKYRTVIEYFEATKIALTATPAIHTVDIFGNSVYNYTYRQAVLDGYLVDYDPPYKIETKLGKEKIKFKQNEKVKIYDNRNKATSTLLLDDEIEIDISGFNKRVITRNFNRAICGALVDYINPEGPEKTLIFAVDNDHADIIVALLKEEYQKADIYYNDNMIVKLTGSVKDVDVKIKRFKIEDFPTIVVTVDLLTTGIDIPKVSNIVFLRKVKSRILYEQMIGRATRKCDEIGKDHFNIFDAVDIYSDFEKVSDMKPVVSKVTVTFEKLLEELDRAKNDKAYQLEVKEEIIGKIQRKKNKIKDREEKLFSAETGWESIDEYIEHIKKMDSGNLVEKLKKELETLEKYEQLRINGYSLNKMISDHDDEVTDVTRVYGDKEMESEDYLEEFRDYVIENQEKIAALKILKTNPKLITRKELSNMRMILDNSGFTKKNLNTAWNSTKNENIVANILIFVKNILNGSPIEDENEKVRDVMKKIYKLERWTMPQKRILEVIEKQLRSNIILTKEDLNNDVFQESFGGYTKINEKLDGKLLELLKVIEDEMLIS